MIAMWRRFVGWLRGPCKRISAGGVYWLAWGDGRHDDSAAIQAAFDRGGTHFPAGEFKFSRPIHCGPQLTAGTLAATTVDGHTTTLRAVRSVTVADAEVQAHSCHIRALSCRIEGSGCAVEPLPEFAEPNFYMLTPADRTGRDEPA